MSDPLLIQQEKQVLSLILNRPEIHNAFDDSQVQRIAAALDEAEADPSIRVLVLRSEGKSFSAGGDINYMRRMGSNSFEENTADGLQLATMLEKLYKFSRPTIARVQGAAMGGGVGLACCCDFVIGTPRARFALSEVNIGLVPATISPFVVSKVGRNTARRMFMTGESVKGEEALRAGFLSDLVEEAELDNKLEATIAALMSSAPEATRIGKALVDKVAGRTIDKSLADYTAELIASLRASEEGREGLTAFLEKREPSWRK